MKEAGKAHVMDECTSKDLRKVRVNVMEWCARIFSVFFSSREGTRRIV